MVPQQVNGRSSWKNFTRSLLHNHFHSPAEARLRCDTIRTNKFFLPATLVKFTPSSSYKKWFPTFCFTSTIVWDKRFSQWTSGISAKNSSGLSGRSSETERFFVFGASFYTISIRENHVIFFLFCRIVRHCLSRLFGLWDLVTPEIGADFFELLILLPLVTW